MYLFLDDYLFKYIKVGDMIFIILFCIKKIKVL